MADSGEEDIPLVLIMTNIAGILTLEQLEQSPKAHIILFHIVNYLDDRPPISCITALKEQSSVVPIPRN
jgi:hypothetical protein